MGRMLIQEYTIPHAINATIAFLNQAINGDWYLHGDYVNNMLLNCDFETLDQLDIILLNEKQLNQVIDYFSNTIFILKKRVEITKYEHILITTIHGKTIIINIFIHLQNAYTLTDFECDMIAIKQNKTSMIIIFKGLECNIQNLGKIIDQIKRKQLVWCVPINDQCAISSCLKKACRLQKMVNLGYVMKENLIPKFIVLNSTSNETCAICTKSLSDIQYVNEWNLKSTSCCIQLTCKHKYHAHCLLCTKGCVKCQATIELPFDTSWS